MHLKDETYLAMIRMFTLSSYMPSIFEAIADQKTSTEFPGVIESGGKYDFKDVKPANSTDYDGNQEEVSSFTLNGEA